MTLQLIPVSPLSADFGRIEYELQLQLNSPHLQITECYELGNPQLSSQFLALAKTFSPQNIIFAYLSTASLSQSVSEISHRGLRIDSTHGFRIQSSTFESDRSTDVSEVIRVAVALGNPLNYYDLNHSWNSNPPTSSHLLSGYQSLRVSKYSDFVVFKSHQIKPCHFVRFKGVTDLDSDTTNLCDLCNHEIATVWCVNDSAKLCRTCDSESHNANRLVAKHRRISLADARALTETCPFHPDMHCEHYCPKCHVGVCMSCKMTGSHSTGDLASHSLVRVNNAYHEALEACGKEGLPFVKLINERIELINASLNAVCSNVDVVKEEIMSLAHAAIEKAKGIAAERILFLESAKTELIRKKSEMKKIGRFLNHQKESVGPLAFLQAFNRYRALIKSMQEVNDLPPKLEIDGDLAVVGEIDVTSRSRKIESKKPARAERLVSPSFTLQFTTLTQIAEQKSRTKGKIGSEFRPFHESRIFLNPEEAVKLYFCFPFKSPPRTHLLFSSEQHGRSISQMHEMIDGIGITALLVRAGNFTFGGFAAAKWVSNGRPFGERSSSFLFSISRDAFIPYQPRVADACNLLATKNTIAFGKCDLRLAGDFNECSSMIENSYGIGFEQGSQEAKTFLAGAPNFVADIVEVWGFFNIES